MTAQGFAGADAEQLDALAQRFDHSAEALEAIRSAIGGGLGRAYWEGRDGEQFRDEWRGRHTTSILAACTLLREMSRALRTNAAQQRGASTGDGTSQTGPGGQPGGGVTAPPAPAATPGTAQVTGNRDWHDVQKGYDAWAAGKSFAQPDYRYQCTSYANYRWHELGYDGPPIRGNGWEMAANAGPVSSQPSLHAMASYGDGSSANHVMIVEEVRADGTVRFSEMNTGTDYNVGRPEEYRDTREIKPVDGKYYANGKEIRFAAFPG